MNRSVHLVKSHRKAKSRQRRLMYVATCQLEPDHTHKFSKRIHFDGHEGNAFDASYTAMVLNGKANFNRMTSGKSNDEVEPLVEGYGEVRKKAGFEFLKTFVEMEGQIARSGRRYIERTYNWSQSIHSNTPGRASYYSGRQRKYLLLPFESKC